MSLLNINDNIAIITITNNTVKNVLYLLFIITPPLFPDKSH